MPSGIPYQSGSLLDLKADGTVRRGDFGVFSAIGVKAAAVGVASLTQSNAKATGAGVIADPSPTKDSYQDNRTPDTVRVFRGCIVDVKIETGTPVVGQYANPTSLATDTTEAGWTATATATDAIGRVVGHPVSGRALVLLLI